jgi:uncharacterized membrane protein YagU involved in acid resistance
MTPIGAAARGLAGGLVATVLLSFLARVLPGMANQPRPRDPLRRPEDPFDAEQVRRWQLRAQAPAAHTAPSGQTGKRESRGAAGWPGTDPATALAQPQAPGPEGLAEQFAFKIASGVFGVDISPKARAVGLATHLAYGSAWGLLYGLLQASYRRPPAAFGALYGLFVWLVGPALLVPAMRLMRPPHQEPPVRTAMLLVGHLAYGVAAAATFEILEREAA